MTYDEIIYAVRAIVGGDKVDNEEIASILRAHGCFYLLAQMPSQKMSIHKELMLNQFLVKLRYKTCADIFEQLSDIQSHTFIPYAVIKGAVLSKQIYGNFRYRISGDIDLLVSPHNAELVKKVLTDNGFIQGRVKDNKIVPYTRHEKIYQKTFSHQLASFVKATGDGLCPFVNIDMNTDILWGESDVKTDMDAFLLNTIPFEIDGFSIKKLRPEEEFIALCLHHYKDMNSIYLLSQGSLKLSLFCDIYYYIKNSPLSISELIPRSKSYKVSQYLFYCIYYTFIVFGDDFLLDMAHQFQSGDGYALLEHFGLRPEEQRSWNHPFAQRLFMSKFYDLYASYLTDSDIRKIEANHKYM